MQPDKRVLVDMATQIAESLVAVALRRLLADAEHARGDGPLMTIAAPVARLALPAAPRRGRKPGPKAKRPYTRRAATQTRAPQATIRGVDLATRYCRKCHKRGLAVRVAGSDKAVRCGGCGFRWNVRVKAVESGGRRAAGRPSTRREAPVEASDICLRCNHHKDLHEDGTGKCMVSRCDCGELYQ